MEIGSRITELRERRGITTNKLANLAGISQSFLREVEMGKKNPTVETLSFICYALGISLREFFTVEAHPINPFLQSAIEQLSEAQQIRLAEFLKEMEKL